MRPHHWNAGPLYPGDPRSSWWSSRRYDSVVLSAGTLHDCRRRRRESERGTRAFRSAPSSMASIAVKQLDSSGVEAESTSPQPSMLARAFEGRCGEYADRGDTLAAMRGSERNERAKHSLKHARSVPVESGVDGEFSPKSRAVAGCIEIWPL